MIPYSCDALTPETLRFTRLSRGFDHPLVDWAEACEAVAWVSFLGMRDASILMRWNFWSRRYMRSLLRDPEIVQGSGHMVDANFEAAQVSDAFRILELAQGYGSTITHTNPFIRRALQQEWHESGITAQKQAEKYNLTRGEVQRLRTPRKLAGSVDSQLYQISFG